MCKNFEELFIIFRVLYVNAFYLSFTLDFTSVLIFDIVSIHLYFWGDCNLQYSPFHSISDTSCFVMKINIFYMTIPGGHKKRNRRFSGLCSEQQLSFSPCWIEHLFLIIITPRSLNLVENFFLWVHFLWTVIFGICPIDFQQFRGTIDDKLMANPENDAVHKKLLIK